MRMTFYRSLDRPMDLFGLKGRWIRTFLISFGVAAAVGAVLGFALGMGAAIATILGGGAACFFGCVLLQGKTSERQLEKARIESKMERYVIRRENISRTVLRDRAYEEYVRRGRKEKE